MTELLYFVFHSGLDRGYWFLARFNCCFDLNDGWVHNRLLYSAFVRNFNQRSVIFFRKCRRHHNLQNNFFKKRFAVLSLSVFKPLDKRNFLGRNFPLLTEAEDINAGAGAER